MSLRLDEKIQTMPRKTLKLIQVALGIVVDEQTHVLTALRPLHYPQGGLWEFPGGKFEPQETPFQALQREFQEEVGITVHKAEFLITVKQRYPHAMIELNAFKVLDYSGVPYGREGQLLQWVNQDKLLGLNFPKGNQKIIECFLKNYGSVR